jgi:hypothetical protein
VCVCLFCVWFRKGLRKFFSSFVNPTSRRSCSSNNGIRTAGVEEECCDGSGVVGGGSHECCCYQRSAGGTGPCTWSEYDRSSCGIANGVVDGTGAHQHGCIFRLFRLVIVFRRQHSTTASMCIEGKRSQAQIFHSNQSALKCRNGFQELI